MIHPEIDIFVCHLKGVVKTVGGFDFDCLEDKSKEEAFEILKKHFSKEDMRQAMLKRIERTLGPLGYDPQISDQRKPFPASQERDSRPSHQSVPEIGKVA